MNFWVVAAALSILLIFTVLLVRWQLLLLPIRWSFAVISWLRVCLALPGYVATWLEAATQERQAATLSHHASIAVTIWGTNTEHRPISRHILASVVAPFYGVALGPRAFSPIEISEGQVLAVAKAVEATGGKPPAAEAKASKA